MYRTLAVCTLIALIAAPVLGHGGIYRPPGDAGSPFGKDGGAAGPPTNPPGGLAAGPSAPASGGTGSVSRGDSRHHGGIRGGHDSATGGLESLGGNGAWESWWDHNKAEFLDVRARLIGGRSTTGDSTKLTGRGRNQRLQPTRAVTEDAVATEIFPALFATLAESGERDLLDSAVLAMARSARPGQADQVLAAAQALLAHPEISVQSSATLSLGVLGSPAAVPLLQDLAVNTSAGRVLVGGSAVPSLVRELAALSLGMLDSPSAVPTLLSLAADSEDSGNNVRACAVIGLGLCHDSAGPEVVDQLIGMLIDRRLDPEVKSFVPTALGKLGDPRALPALMAAFTDRDAHNYVVESIAIALGRLGSVDRPDVVAGLVACYDRASDMSARQFALMSLARIAARDEVPEGAREAHGVLMSWLTEQVSRPARHSERPWAALAAGIAARSHPEHQGAVINRLVEGYDDSSDPSVKAAFALSLGLLESQANGGMILDDLQKMKDPTFRGYAAVALGLIGHEAAKDRMREMCSDRHNVPSLRLQLATGLALMRDLDTVPMLIATLHDAETLGLVAAVAQSLGLIGDATALQPLKEALADSNRAPLTRAFASVSLGLLAERTRLPWHAAIRADNNYLIDIPPMSEVFDIP